LSRAIKTEVSVVIFDFTFLITFLGCLFLLVLGAVVMVTFLLKRGGVCFWQVPVLWWWVLLPWKWSQEHHAVPCLLTLRSGRHRAVGQANRREFDQRTWQGVGLWKPIF